MKKIFLVLLVAVFVISCKKEAPIDYAVISGKITNTKNGKLFFSSTKANKVIDTIILAKDGSFIDTVKVADNGYYLFDGKNGTYLNLEAGNNITVNYDADNYDNSIAFAGEGFEISKYYSEDKKAVQNILGKGREVYKLEEDAYKSKMMKVKTTLEDLLKNTKGISESFKQKELKNIKYRYLDKLNIYESYHAYFTKNKDFKVSENFLDELKDFDYTNEEDFKNSRAYRSIVSNKASKRADEIAKRDTIDKVHAFLRAAKEVKQQSIKNALAYEAAKYGITYTDNLKSFFKEFKEISTDEANIAEITKTYNKLLSLAEGQPSPKFNNYENYNGGTSSLDDFKGKYVYIDVWATWCGPCRAQIPFLKKLEKKYRGKNIAFVSISIDKATDHDKWKKMVEDKELEGVQLFADNDWKSAFVENFQIRGIPRFILIDPNGNIVNANAPQPSSTEIEKVFGTLKL